MRRAALALACALLAFVSGCSSLNDAKTGANALRVELVAAAPGLFERCVDPYVLTPRTTPDEAAAMTDAFDRSGCSRDLRAFDAARRARAALVAVIVAIEAGDCAGTSSTVSRCNVGRAYAAAAAAGADLLRVRK